MTDEAGLVLHGGTKACSVTGTKDSKQVVWAKVHMKTITQEMERSKEMKPSTATVWRPTPLLWVHPDL